MALIMVHLESPSTNHFEGCCCPLFLWQVQEYIIYGPQLVL